MPTPSGKRGRGLVGALQVGDDDPRALGGEPVRDRVTDALRGAGDDRDLAVELHSADRRERRRQQDAVLLGVEQRLHLARNVLPARVGLQPRPALLTLRVARVAPECGVGRERADVGRERPEEVAEMLLLQLDPLRRVQPHELVRACR